jgi:hypothetical protein
MRKLRSALIGLGTTAALAAPATAFAGVSDGGVSPSGGNLGASGSAGGGALPFTGMNLLLIVGLGIGLVLLGIMLRRRGHNEA